MITLRNKVMASVALAAMSMYAILSLWALVNPEGVMLVINALSIKAPMTLQSFIAGMFAWTVLAGSFALLSERFYAALNK